jgi:hypothetical protein
MDAALEIICLVFIPLGVPNRHQNFSLPINLPLTIRVHASQRLGEVIPDVSAPRSGASVDREV